MVYHVLNGVISLIFIVPNKDDVISENNVEIGQKQENLDRVKSRSNNHKILRITR